MTDTHLASDAWLESKIVGGVQRVSLHGAWAIDTVADLDGDLSAIRPAGGARFVLDLSDIGFIDTSGAWLIRRFGERLQAGGATVEFAGISDNARRLLEAVGPVPELPTAQGRSRFVAIQLLETLGRSTSSAGADFLQALSILGGVVRGLGRAILRPSRFRFTSIVSHLDRAGLQAVPIVFLISFLIGGIIAQQGIFQLSFFGADVFVVDLVGILILREIGVLLTAIMLAGRSGSAYTAEIGSMKMREELDALKVIGLDPIEVLIMPRLIALVIALPMLTFLADMSGLFGGAVVSYFYGNMSFDTYILYLRDAVDMSTLNVGLIKAPFMGLIVGLIAATEGLNVQGSSESLGRRTTSSVVKAIFMVIVADGLFSIFFASIDY